MKKILLAVIAAIVVAVAIVVWQMRDDGPFKRLANAWIYGVPLVVFDVTEEVMINAERNGSKAIGLNKWAHVLDFPTHEFTEVVAPNADTLYSSLWLDLSGDGVVVHIPAIEDRFELVTGLNAWGNVFISMGSRTTGSEPMDLLIVGPDWTGFTPEGLTLVRSETNQAWLLNRLRAIPGPDKEIANAIQKQFTVKPLSQYQNPNYEHPKYIVDDTVSMQAPWEQVVSMDANTFFNRLNVLLDNTPTPILDNRILAAIRPLGIGPGLVFDANELGIFGETLANLVIKKTAEKLLQLGADKSAQSKQPGGWMIAREALGEYGTDYPMRAYVTAIGFGANLTADAVYPRTTVDIDGVDLNGANDYVIHFDADEIPPAYGFWSLTMYNDKDFFVDNKLDRYNLSSQSDLKFNEDGSLDIYIGHLPPASGEQNWLPAPEGDFTVMLRLYWPDVSVLNGEWNPPGIDKL